MTQSIAAIPFHLIDGTLTSLADYHGKVLLLVNVASQCGLTPQYRALEDLFLANKEDGLVILGFPSNDFGAQEPGNHEEIVEFCSMNFGVSFPLAEKIIVKGAGQHPLYQSLTAAQPIATETDPGVLRSKLAGYGFLSGEAADILWNFEKFLVSRTGEVVARFGPDVTPDHPVVLAAIAHQLQAS